MQYAYSRVLCSTPNQNQTKSIFGWFSFMTSNEKRMSRYRYDYFQAGDGLLISITFPYRGIRCITPILMNSTATSVQTLDFSPRDDGQLRLFRSRKSKGVDISCLRVVVNVLCFEKFRGIRSHANNLEWVVSRVFWTARITDEIAHSRLWYLYGWQVETILSCIKSRAREEYRTKISTDAYLSWSGSASNTTSDADA